MVEWLVIEVAGLIRLLLWCIPIATAFLAPEILLPKGRALRRRAEMLRAAGAPGASDAMSEWYQYQHARRYLYYLSYIIGFFAGGLVPAFILNNWHAIGRAMQ